MDTYTVTSSSSWFDRLGRSAKGLCMGPIVMVIGCVLLFWNEGRAVARYKDLQESAKAVIIVDDISTVNADLDGKLVHMTGNAAAAAGEDEDEEGLMDPDFHIETDGIRLRRSVEMYQWVEHQKSETQKKTGGGADTTTTYEYTMEWESHVVNSNKFAIAGHENPSTMSYNPLTLTADSIQFGAFDLASSPLVDRIDWFDTMMTLDKGSIPDDILDEGATVSSNYVYFGKKPAYPEVGDVRVSFAYVPSGTLSLMAVQKGSTFKAFTTSRGGTVLFVQAGDVSADEMLSQAERENETTTWILRLLGFVLIYLGVSAVARPLVVFADVLPILGDILESGVVPCLSCLISTVLSSLVIAVAWVYYRPLVGIAMLVVSFALSYFAYRRVQNRREMNGGIPGSTLKSFKMGKGMAVPMEEA